MSKIDDIFVKVKGMASVAGSKAQEIAELAKLRLQLSQLRSELDANYQKMGEIIYNLKKAGAENDDLVAMCISEIDKQLEEIEKINEKINEMRNEVKCDECMAANSVGSIYCTRCGAQLKRTGDGAQEWPMEAQAVEVVTEQSEEQT